MEQFLARIEPFDAQADVPVMTVEMRMGPVRRSFELTERATLALREALARYTDPDDCGQCGECGGYLDQNLQCRNCGHIGGVFGSTIAHHLAEVAGRQGE